MQFLKEGFLFQHGLKRDGAIFAAGNNQRPGGRKHHVGTVSRGPFFFVTASGLLQLIARFGFQKLWTDHGQSTVLSPERHITTGTNRQAFQVFSVGAQGFQQRKIPGRP